MVRSYNLTERQQSLARFLVKAVRAQALAESFLATHDGGGIVFMQGDFGAVNDDDFREFKDWISTDINGNWCLEWPLPTLDALREAGLLIQSASTGGTRRCTFTRLIYAAVDSDFKEEERLLPISALAHPHPPEIAMSLDRLRNKYPDPKKVGFLIMRFTAAKPYQRIVDVVKATGAKYNLEIIRADETEFHADLWGNVRTHLHGCGFGIAVYERIQTDEPNANIGLEVGYLMAMNKPVMLLKDQTVEILQADLTGKLYKVFDPHDPEATIPDQLTKWLQDNGVIVP